MADIFDYLDWRADVPLSADPFNEVDNLVLAELAYTDFTGIVPSFGEPVSITDACTLFFQMHDREEILKDTSPTAKAPLLMEKLVTGCRFANMQLCRYINEIDVEKTVQLSAITFLLDDGTAYVAYRGTDSTVIGWKEDFDLGCLTETSGQLYSVQYLEDVASKYALPLRVGGHSKGGNFAVFASSACSAHIQERILSVYSNDGPGFREETVNSDGYTRILPKVISIIPDTSIIGLLLISRAKHLVVKSTAFGIYQHDGFSWCVKRNRFESTELSELGKVLNSTLDSWVDGMDDETRKSMTDTIFSVIGSTGLDTFHEMSKQKWKSAEAMLGSLFSISREKQSELLRLAGQLVKSGSQAAIEQLPEALSKGKKEDQPDQI